MEVLENLLAAIAVLIVLATAAAPPFFLMVAVASAPGTVAAFFEKWQRMMADDERLQLWSVMRQLGLAREDAGREPRALAVATRRCVMCRSIDKCNRWLATGDGDGLGAFCPNAMYLKNLRRSTGRR